MNSQSGERTKPTAHLAHGSVVTPQSGEPPFPSLREVSAWIRQAQRRRVPLPWRQRLSNLYMLLLATAMSAGALYQLLARATRGGVGEQHSTASFCTAPAGCAGTPYSLPVPVASLTASALVLLGLAVLTGALRRLGPLFLRPEETHWLLPLPGRRGPLLRRRLLRVVLIGTGTGAALGATAALGLLAVTGGPGPRGAAHAGAVCLLVAASALFAMICAGAAQTMGRSGQLARTVLLTLAAVNALLAVGAMPAVDSAAPVSGLLAPVSGLLAPAALPLQALALTVAATYLWMRRVGPNVERIADLELLETSRRALGAQVAGASLDSRALGQLFAPATRKPRHSLQLPLVRLAARRSRLARTVAVVLQADFMVLVRQRWRLAQLTTGVVFAAILLLPLTPMLRLGILLVSGATASLAAGAAARAAHAEPEAENLLPSSALSVRAAHLTAPLLVLLPWAATVGVALHLGTPPRPEKLAQVDALTQVDALASPNVAGAASLWLLVAQCLLLAIAWAAASVRSAFRPSPNWNLFVATEMGPVPVGLATSIATGPDVALLSVLPLVPVLAGGAATAATVAAQFVVACVALTAAVLPARQGT